MYSKFILNQLKPYIKDNDLVYLSNQNVNFMITYVLSDFYLNHKTIFMVMPTLYDAQKCYDTLTNMGIEEDVLFFPADELVAVELLDVSGDFKYERINTITSLIKDDKPYIVVTNINGAIRMVMNEKRWEDHFITINKNQTLDEKKLYSKLVDMGYVYSYTVTKTGEFSHRGSIIDIFPMNMENPIRLDMFDDEVDEIKVFDIESQKSVQKIDSVLIIPVTEMIYSDNELLIAEEKIKEFINLKISSKKEREKFELDLSNLLRRKGVDNLSRFIRFFDDDPCSILDYKQDKRVYVINQSGCEETYEHMISDLQHFCEQIDGYNIFKLNYFNTIDKLINKSNVITQSVVDFSNLNAFDFGTSIPESFNANRDLILKYITKTYQKNTLILLVKNISRFENLIEDFKDSFIKYNIVKDHNDISCGQVNIIDDTYAPSFISQELNLVVLNEDTLFKIKYEPRKPKYKSIYKNTTKISKYDELEIDDYVVHFDHGIGKYKGLDIIESNGAKRDFIKIEYDGGDTLHIPVEQISLIEKYTLVEEKQVKLSRLGTKAWSIAKERVRKKVAEMSAQLIRLYAERQASTGFAFYEDTADQVLFEADFGYELTPDQEVAIYEIKKEMETAKVMDRLVCGDVGYGKTEVALRAAFKAVQSGKQVAVLAPTTILSRQHFYTFKNRMEQFGVRVDLVNRLQSGKNVKDTIAGLKSGVVDVVIGTHKLLNGEIQYKDLGLLIIDEEQRFGVIQKEKIKELKVNVDTITLSATPIPRTLQMSMIGIKSLSMLETPPKNRYPIQTYVLERNKSIVRDAIMREIARGGQVFYMYNKTQSIDMIAAEIQSLCPDARICVGHGKMDKAELERVITSFIDQKYDVLICTTIIETGIDMPNANTLIVHDADLLGLSQLYQLRGRVGRSDKIAYAYLMYGGSLFYKQNAAKRLEIIKEFNELGSGFKIAMKDLAIRGAGDILGESQSGFIETVGLETYLHILEEELKSINEPYVLEEKVENDPSLNMAYASRTISNSYIENEDVKIEIHKKIDKIKSMNDLNKLSEELRDRFGVYDTGLKVYMHEKLMTYLCRKMGIKKILDTKTQMILFMSKEQSAKMDGLKLFNLVNDTSKSFNLHYYNRQIEIIVDKTMLKENEHIILLAEFMDKLIKIS